MSFPIQTHRISPRWKTARRVIAAAACGMVLFGQAAVAFAQSATSSLSLTSSAQCVGTGQNVTVTVKLDGATNVSTVQTTITYDASVFDVSDKPQLGASFPIGFRNTTDTTNGKIELSASNNSSINGSADFATIVFKPKKSAATVIDFDKNATIVLSTDKENTNVLGSTHSLSLTACSGFPGSTNSNVNGSNTNTNSSYYNTNTNSSTTSGGQQCSQPSGFAINVKSNGVLISWSDTDDRANSFIVHYGLADKNAFDTAFLANDQNLQQTGNNFSMLLQNIAPGKSYHVALSAVGNCSESALTPTLNFQSGNAGSTGTTSTGTDNSNSTGSVTYTNDSNGGNGGTTTSGTHSSAVSVNSKSARLNASLLGGTKALKPTGPKEALMVTFMIIVGVVVFSLVRRKKGV